MTYQQIVNSISLLINSPAIRTKKIHLTTPQVKALFSTPIEVVSAPGTGRAISIIDAYISINFATEPFNFAQDEIALALTNGTDSGVIVDLALRDLKFYLNTPFSGQWIFPFGDTFGNASALLTDTALKVGTSSNATEGDGTIDLYIAYRIITL
jgi:hypothetical protein